MLIGDVQDDVGEGLAERLGPEAIYRHLDLTDALSCQAAGAACHDRYGPVTVLANNAGITVTGSVASAAMAEFERAVSLGPTWVMVACRRPLRQGWPRRRRAGIRVAATETIQWNEINDLAKRTAVL